VAVLERAAADALRPQESVLDDGWMLRADGALGVVRRANAVLPRAAGRDPLDAKLARAEVWYRARGRAPRLLVAPDAEPVGLVAALAAAGYRFEVPVLVLVRPLAPGSAWGDEVVACAAAPDDAWCAAYAATLPERERAERLRLALGAPGPKAYAAVGADGCGLAVRSGDLVGLFDVATAPAARRRGVARRVTAALLAWGLAAGAQRAYLQVAEDNAAARALYAGFGFRPAYRYVYAARPSGPGVADQYRS
jgi:ribosomal protein S18 acetylase RimI-like enzyme